MSKKDFEKAARIVQGWARDVHPNGVDPFQVAAITEAFIELFRGEADGRFDEDRFRRACVPGANVRARS